MINMPQDTQDTISVLFYKAVTRGKISKNEIVTFAELMGALNGNEASFSYDDLENLRHDVFDYHWKNLKEPRRNEMRRAFDAVFDALPELKIFSFSDIAQALSQDVYSDCKVFHSSGDDSTSDMTLSIAIRFIRGLSYGHVNESNYEYLKTLLSRTDFARDDKSWLIDNFYKKAGNSYVRYCLFRDCEVELSCQKYEDFDRLYNKFLGSIDEVHYRELKTILQYSTITEEQKMHFFQKTFNKVDVLFEYRMLFEDNFWYNLFKNKDAIEEKREQFIERNYSSHANSDVINHDILKRLSQNNNLPGEKKYCYLKKLLELIDDEEVKQELFDYITDVDIKWKILYEDHLLDAPDKEDIFSQYLEKIFSKPYFYKSSSERTMSIIHSEAVNENAKHQFINKLYKKFVDDDDMNEYTFLVIKELLNYNGLSQQEHSEWVELYNKSVCPDFFESLEMDYGKEFYRQLRKAMKLFLESPDDRCFLEIPVQELGIHSSDTSDDIHQQTYNQAIRTIYYTMSEYFSDVLSQNHDNGISLGAQVFYRERKYVIKRIYQNNTMVYLKDRRTGNVLQDIDVRRLTLNTNNRVETAELFEQFSKMKHPQKQYTNGLFIQSAGTNIGRGPFELNKKDENFPLKLTTSNDIPKSKFDLVVLFGDNTLMYLPNEIKSGSQKIIYIGTSLQEQSFMKGCQTITFSLQQMAEWFDYQVPEVEDVTIEAPVISQLLYDNRVFEDVGRLAVKQARAYLMSWLAPFDRAFVEEVIQHIDSNQDRVEEILSGVLLQEEVANEKFSWIDRFANEHPDKEIYIITSRNAEFLVRQYYDRLPNVHIIKHFSFKRAARNSQFETIPNIAYHCNDKDNIYIFDNLFNKDVLLNNMGLYAIQGHFYNLKYKEEKQPGLIKISKVLEVPESHASLLYDYQDIGIVNRWLDSEDTDTNAERPRQVKYVICLDNKETFDVDGQVLDLNTGKIIDVSLVHKGDRIVLYNLDRAELDKKAREVNKVHYQLAQNYSRKWKDCLYALLQRYYHNYKRLHKALNLTIQLSTFMTYCSENSYNRLFPQRQDDLKKILNLAVKEGVATVTEEDEINFQKALKYKGLKRQLGSLTKDEELAKRQHDETYTSRFLKEGTITSIEKTYDI